MARTGEIWWLLSPMSPLWGCAGLLLGACHSISVPSRRGGADWVALGNRDPFGSSQLCCHHKEVGSVLGLSPHGSPHGGAVCPPAQRHDVPPMAPWGHKDVPPEDASQALASNMHEERGGGQGRPVLGEQVDVAVPWGQRGLSEWQGAVPNPGGQWGGTCTHLGACWAGAV